MSQLDPFSKNVDLRRRILFTLGALALCRIGSHIPTPGVNGAAIAQFFESQKGSIFGMFNMFSGGALNRFSVLALGIMPYITSSIIFSLLQTIVPYLEALKKEGEHGRKKINQYTRYGALLVAGIQSYGICSWLKNMPGAEPLVYPYVSWVPIEAMTIITLTAGTCFLMWMGEQITERGIGNGSSLIIFTGIVAGIPAGAFNTLNMVKNGEMAPFWALMLLVFMVIVIGLIIFLEAGQRRITIQYSARGGSLGGSAPSSHLPLKINFSGVIPPIFASSLLMFPATITQFTTVPFLLAIRDSLNRGGVMYNVLFVSLIIFFSFFYMQVVFNPNDVAENLKKYGGFIPGIRAGRNTADYIQKILERVNVGGAIYLAAICVLPSILINKFNLQFYFGGTSLLILVGVALDTSQQIQSHLLTQKYEGFMKGVKIRSRRIQY